MLLSLRQIEACTAFTTAVDRTLGRVEAVASQDGVDLADGNALVVDRKFLEVSVDSVAVRFLCRHTPIIPKWGMESLGILDYIWFVFNKLLDIPTQIYHEVVDRDIPDRVSYSERADAT